MFGEKRQAAQFGEFAILRAVACPGLAAKTMLGAGIGEHLDARLGFFDRLDIARAECP